jgi:regulation of enolase protein 1 (concanavalin A-like superfamily)
MQSLDLAALPAALSWSNEPLDVQTDGNNNLSFAAGPLTDWFYAPAGDRRIDNSPLALFAPPDVHCTLAARVTVDFGATFDAGVLFVHADGERWAKLCFEYAPTGEPMIVSVVTRARSDDCNSVLIDGNTVDLRVYRQQDVLTFHYSTDGERWHLVRHFTIGALDDVKLGFCAQSPTGEGCTVQFADIAYRSVTIADIRSGE